jgi:hypothetical protein
LSSMLRSVFFFRCFVLLFSTKSHKPVENCRGMQRDFILILFIYKQNFL